VLKTFYFKKNSEVQKHIN